MPIGLLYYSPHLCAFDTALALIGIDLLDIRNDPFEDCAAADGFINRLCSAIDRNLKLVYVGVDELAIVVLEMKQCGIGSASDPYVPSPCVADHLEIVVALHGWLAETLQLDFNESNLLIDQSLEGL